MTEMHLRQPAALANLRFTYSGCRPSTKNIEKIQEFSEKGNSRYIYQNELD